MKHVRVILTVTFLVAAAVGGVSAAFAGISRPGFCDSHPNNPKCKQKPAPTPTSTPTSTATAAPTATPTPSPTSTPAPTPTPTPSPTSSPSPTGQRCTNPSIVFNGQDAQGIDDYYADADIWNPYPGMSQTMGVCTHSSWYTVDTADNSTGDGAVKAYPNIHYDFIDWGTGVMPKLSAYNTITTSFANTTPKVGIYDTAYDIWFNDVGESNTSNEVMIWTDNNNQYPLGSVRGQTTFSGTTWNVYATTPDNTGAEYVAFVPVNNGVLTSGTIDLKAVATYLQTKTVNATPLLPANTTIGQVDYGVEVVSTNGTPTRWDFTNFSVTSS